MAYGHKAISATVQDEDPVEHRVVISKEEAVRRFGGLSYESPRSAEVQDQSSKPNKKNSIELLEYEDVICFDDSDEDNFFGGNKVSDSAECTSSRSTYFTLSLFDRQILSNPFENSFLNRDLLSPFNRFLPQHPPSPPSSPELLH